MEDTPQRSERYEDDPDAASEGDALQDDVSLDALEDLYEQSRRAENATDSPIEAMAEGLVYSPPEAPPVEPGGEDDAFIPSGEVDSDDLARSIIDALEGNPNTFGFRIRFRVHGGIVTLTGRVPTRDDADEVERTVYAVPGVDEVVSHLEIA